MLHVKCERYCVKITSDTGRTWIARNRRDIINIIPTLPETSFMCSSSLDWPEDVTEDLNVIEVCNIIRGNSVRSEDIEKMHAERNK